MTGHEFISDDLAQIWIADDGTIRSVNPEIGIFGIIKDVQGFRQFLLRGLDSVQSEWTLVCIGWNLKRMHALNG